MNRMGPRRLLGKASWSWWLTAVLASLVSLAGPLTSDAAADDTASARRIGLDEAIGEALAHHPRLRGDREGQTAAAELVHQADVVALPSVGISAELNRSTSNATPGTFFPVRGLPNVAGAPRAKALDGGTWQSGLGVWASWDVLSVVRQANAVDEALAGKGEADAIAAARRLDIAYRAADTFLLALEAEAVARAARASSERAEVLVTTTKALVAQSLRPGADAARADAELAAARTLVARATQGRALRRAQLAEALGTPDASLEPEPGRLLEPVDRLMTGTGAVKAEHPEVRVADAQVTRAAEVQRRAGLDYLPRLDLVAALWTRGSGTFDSPANGLVPDVANWGAGATLSWSLLDVPAIRARVRAAAANKGMALARRDEAKLAIAGQVAAGRAAVTGALAVAAETPKALLAASAAEQQALARYKSGVASVMEVADAQRLLAQSELDDALARLEARRAMLLLARATGDLDPVLRSLQGGR